MRMIYALVCILSAIYSDTANAALKPSSSAEICAYLNAVALPTQGWKDFGGNDFGCSSNYKELESEFPLANNIAYYVDGDRSGKVHRVYLVLNVNARSSAKAAHKELLDDSTILITKAAIGVIPPEIKFAILNGKPASAKVGQALVTVTRSDWPTGRGYEIHVNVE